METAQVILKLAGHQELLKAELAQIEEDRKQLVELAKRYPEQKALFTAPHKDLTSLKKSKEGQEKEIRLHLQCYDLHRPTGEKILAALNKSASAHASHQQQRSNDNTTPQSSATAAAAKRQVQESKSTRVTEGFRAATASTGSVSNEGASSRGYHTTSTSAPHPSFILNDSAATTGVSDGVASAGPFQYEVRSGTQPASAALQSASSVNATVGSAGSSAARFLSLSGAVPSSDASYFTNYLDGLGIALGSAASLRGLNEQQRQQTLPGGGLFSGHERRDGSNAAYRHVSSSARPSSLTDWRSADSSGVGLTHGVASSTADSSVA